MNDELFKAFCAKEDGRYKLTAPWVASGYRYATNGWICVRQRCDEPDTIPGEQRFPPAAEQFKPRDNWKDEPIDIAACDYAAKKIECGECDGAGWQEFDIGHEHECDDCDGVGSWTEWDGFNYGNPDHNLSGEYIMLAKRFGFTLYAPKASGSAPILGLGPNGEEALFMPRKVEK